MMEKKLFASVIAFAALFAIICIYGIVVLPSPDAKLLCGVLWFFGMAMSLSVYAACRRDTLLMASTLEDTLIAAEQGHLSDTGIFSDESLTHKLCLRAMRLAESTNNKAQEQKALRNELQATVNNLAHQLRTPVANLTLYADTLAVGDLPLQKQTEFLNILAGQAHKLEFLVNALVKTGRLETGAIQMKPDVISLITTIKQAAALAKPFADSKGLTFTLDCPKELVLLHDPKWTAEAIFNLLENAIKYTAHGSVSLTVQKWEIYTCIEVTDTGCGFTQEDAALLFSRFYRSVQATDIPGMGLGLYIVRQIAQLQGGYVLAKALKQGSSFRLFLPNID